MKILNRQQAKFLFKVFFKGERQVFLVKQNVFNLFYS